MNKASITLASIVIASAVVAHLNLGCSDDSSASHDTIDASTSDGAATADAGAELDGGDASPSDGAPPFPWNLPPGFPEPVVPPDNPMTVEKVELGRRLFYDKRLSKNQTQSCASCHVQSLAFTDGLARSVGSTGVVHPRSSMTLANVGYSPTFTWANPNLLTLERQAQVPLFNTEPVELGLTDADDVETPLAAEPIYIELFARSFPESASRPITLANALKAIASFERTLVSGRSPFDRWLYDKDDSAISESAKRGYVLFNSEKLECFHCHIGFALSDHATWAGKAFTDRPYHNTGLYNIDGAGAYPAPNTGVEAISLEPSDMGRFKVPTLRNVEVTAPYMHDGSIATLDEVLDHYIAGGRTIPDGQPNAGNGNLNPFKDPLIVPLVDVTPQDRADVIAFLKSLTDHAFLTNPAFSDPWKQP